MDISELFINTDKGFKSKNFSSSLRLTSIIRPSIDDIITDLDVKNLLVLPSGSNITDRSKGSKTGVDLIDFEKNTDPISIPGLFIPVYESDGKTIINYKINNEALTEDFKYSGEYGNAAGIIQYVKYLKKKGIRLDTDLNIGANQNFQKVTFDDFNTNTKYIKNFPFNKITKEQIIKLQHYHGLVNGKNSKGQLLVPEDGWVGSQTSQMTYPRPNAVFYRDTKIEKSELDNLEQQFKIAKNKLSPTLPISQNQLMAGIRPNPNPNFDSQLKALKEEYNQIKLTIENTVRIQPAPPRGPNIWFPIIWGNRRFVAKIQDQIDNYNRFQKTGKPLPNGQIGTPPYDTWQLYDPAKHPLQFELIDNNSAKLKEIAPEWFNENYFIEIGKSMATINKITGMQKKQATKTNADIKIIEKINNNIKSK